MPDSNIQPACRALFRTPTEAVGARRLLYSIDDALPQTAASLGRSSKRRLPHCCFWLRTAHAVGTALVLFDAPLHTHVGHHRYQSLCRYRVSCSPVALSLVWFALWPPLSVPVDVKQLRRGQLIMARQGSAQGCTGRGDCRGNFREMGELSPDSW